jgi:hypothetical protein
MLPDPLLERLHAGDEPARAELLARATPEQIEAGLQQLRASDQEVLARYSPRVVMAELARRRVRRTVRRTASSLLVVALALLALWLQPGAPTERSKGDPLLSVLLEGRGPPLPDGAVLQPGERLQLVLDPAGAPHAAVVSVDGRGQVTLHLPREGNDTRLPSAGALALDRSFRLDDAPNFEVFYALTSQEPIELDLVVEAAARGGPERELALEGVQQTRFVLHKP